MKPPKKFFPKIRFVVEMPQEIISSPAAAYHPWTQTIFILGELPAWIKAIFILHEIGHHYISFFNCGEVFHKNWDTYLEELWIYKKILKGLVDSGLYKWNKQ